MGDIEAIYRLYAMVVLGLSVPTWAALGTARRERLRLPRWTQVYLAMVVACGACVGVAHVYAPWGVRWAGRAIAAFLVAAPPMIFLMAIIEWRAIFSLLDGAYLLRNRKVRRTFAAVCIILSTLLFGATIAVLIVLGG